MAVFRIEKTRDYTVMSNHHLRDTGLSLKSKGLLSMMLSLPENWNYTTRGLVKICKEGTDSIGSALKELERAEQLLMNTDLPIGRIAQIVGYQNPSRFAQLFRRSTGQSPAEFRALSRL